MRVILLFWLCTAAAEAQILSPAVRSAALGGQAAAVEEGAGTVFLNPALLCGRNELSLWLGYHRPFGLAELQAKALALKWARSSIATAAGFVAWGNGLYQEWDGRFAAAGAFLSNFSAGMTLRMRRVEIVGYGAAAQGLADLGVRFALSSSATLAALVRNAFPLGRSDLPAPAREWLSAVRIAPRRDFTLWLEVAHQRPFAPEVRIAAEIRPVRQLSFLAGSAIGNTEAFTVGLNLRLPALRLRYALRSIDPLPATHLFAVELTRAHRP